jgi:uncharacterized protein (TIGR03000 family)
MRRLRELQCAMLAVLGSWLATGLLAAQTPAPSEPARIKVYLPSDAVLHVDGALTQATGEIRNFVSPPLQPGRKFVYTLRATWKEGGKEIQRERTVRVEADKETVVDFRAVDAPEVKIRDAAMIAVSTPGDVAEKMLELAGVQKGDVVYDPKCADATILIKAAQKYGVRGIGFETDADRVKDAVENVKKSGVSDLVFVSKMDLGVQDFKDATVVALHLSSDENVKLMPQLAKLKAGTRIVSDEFDMKGAKPKQKITFRSKGNNPTEDKDHFLYLWVVPWEKE